mmetsp:Transcript_66904/g.118760  ORF Transcript_66904/g.118760 Transcript_66904/m.118760 type:complete len:233 (+) Transcript_66904:266-964(+)
MRCVSLSVCQFQISPVPLGCTTLDAPLEGQQWCGYGCLWMLSYKIPEPSIIIILLAGGLSSVEASMRVQLGERLRTGGVCLRGNGVQDQRRQSITKRLRSGTPTVRNRSFRGSSKAHKCLWPLAQPFRGNLPIIIERFAEDREVVHSVGLQHCQTESPAGKGLCDWLEGPALIRAEAKDIEELALTLGPLPQDVSAVGSDLRDLHLARVLWQRGDLAVDRGGLAMPEHTGCQ